MEPTFEDLPTELKRAILRRMNVITIGRISLCRSSGRIDIWKQVSRVDLTPIFDRELWQLSERHAAASIVFSRLKASDARVDSLIIDAKHKPLSLNAELDASIDYYVPNLTYLHLDSVSRSNLAYLQRLDPQKLTGLHLTRHLEVFGRIDNPVRDLLQKGSFRELRYLSVFVGRDASHPNLKVLSQINLPALEELHIQLTNFKTGFEAIQAVAVPPTGRRPNLKIFNVNLALRPSDLGSPQLLSRIFGIQITENDFSSLKTQIEQIYGIKIGGLRFNSRPVWSVIAQSWNWGPSLERLYDLCYEHFPDARGQIVDMAELLAQCSCQGTFWSTQRPELMQMADFMRRKYLELDEERSIVMCDMDRGLLDPFRHPNLDFLAHLVCLDESLGLEFKGDWELLKAAFSTLRKSPILIEFFRLKPVLRLVFDEPVEWRSTHFDVYARLHHSIPLWTYLTDRKHVIEIAKDPAFFPEGHGWSLIGKVLESPTLEDFNSDVHLVMQNVLPKIPRHELCPMFFYRELEILEDPDTCKVMIRYLIEHQKEFGEYGLFMFKRVESLQILMQTAGELGLTIPQSVLVAITWSIWKSLLASEKNATELSRKATLIWALAKELPQRLSFFLEGTAHMKCALPESRVKSILREVLPVPSRWTCTVS